MVANPARRVLVADSALECLGNDGARGLTHRSVDAASGLPTGTTSNYFPTRAGLLVGIAERIFDRLAPDPIRLHRLESVQPPRDAVVAYAQDVLERLLAAPELALALVELRLEAARNPAVAEVLTPFLREGLRADVAFHQARGLPGGAEVVRLVHYAVDGIVLDQLTVPLVPDADPAAAARRIVEGLLTPAHSSPSSQRDGAAPSNQ